MLKLPSAAVVAESAVPVILTAAPATGSPVTTSATVPLMSRVCASAAPARRTANEKTAHILCMMPPLRELKELLSWMRRIRMSQVQ